MLTTIRATGILRLHLEYWLALCRLLARHLCLARLRSRLIHILIGLTQPNCHLVWRDAVLAPRLFPDALTPILLWCRQGGVGEVPKLFR